MTDEELDAAIRRHEIEAGFPDPGPEISAERLREMIARDKAELSDLANGAGNTSASERDASGRDGRGRNA
jgi:hypothetical protein